MGGKSRLAPHLAKVILDSATDRGIYLEPFVGGGAMFATMAPHFDMPIAGDAHPDLALMWQAVAEGWLPPSEVTEDEHRALRDAEPSALRGFVGFGCSFGGKWFGTYVKAGARAGARAYAGQSPAQVAAGEPSRWIVKHAGALSDLAVIGGDYGQLDRAALPGAVVYCDPPYAGTTAYRGVAPFDHDRFWSTMRAWSARGAHVFVSEYAAPADWRSVWERAAPGSGTFTRATAGATERLFTHD